MIWKLLRRRVDRERWLEGLRLVRLALAPLVWWVVAWANGAAFADAGGLTAADIKIYQQAFAAADRDQWPQARALAAKAQNQLPAKVIEWLDLVRPGPGRDFDEMTAFLANNPEWPLRGTLQGQAERAMPDD